MMTGDDVLMMPAMHRVEVFTGMSRRRRWSREQKAQIVAESYATTTSETSARHGVSKTQLFGWRREAREVRSRIEFAKVEVETDRGDRSPDFGMIEVGVDGCVVRLNPGADAGLATAIIFALKGRGR